MTEASRKSKPDSKIIILAVVILAVFAVGGYMMYKDNQKQTVSINIGGKEISATFDQ